MHICNAKELLPENMQLFYQSAAIAKINAIKYIKCIR